MSGKRTRHRMTPEEYERRVAMYESGSYTLTRMAEELDITYAAAQNWACRYRKARGAELAREAERAAAKERRKGYPFFGFTAGEELKIGVVSGQGAKYHVRWRKGTVLEVYPRFAVVQLPRYRMTVSRWDIKLGVCRIERLGEGEQWHANIKTPVGGSTGG